MFLIIPISLIFISAVGILAIILRKKSYLNKLYSLNSGENIDSGLNVLSYGNDFFPELVSFLDRLQLGKYKAHWLLEAEKMLRKNRLIFQRIDRVSDLMITKIRRIHVNHKLNNLNAISTAEIVATPVAQVISENKISPAFLRNEEERLIIEIAKNPKDYKLYEELGDVYISMENFEDAQESYKAAIELNPQDESLKEKLSGSLAHLNS